MFTLSYPSFARLLIIQFCFSYLSIRFSQLSLVFFNHDWFILFLMALYFRILLLVLISLTSDFFYFCPIHFIFCFLSSIEFHFILPSHSLGSFTFLFSVHLVFLNGVR